MEILDVPLGTLLMGRVVSAIALCLLHWIAPSTEILRLSILGGDVDVLLPRLLFSLGL